MTMNLRNLFSLLRAVRQGETLSSLPFSCITVNGNAAYRYALTKEARKLLPAHYQKRCEEFMTREPEPVHWVPEEGKFKLNPRTGKPERVQNVPIKVRYPIESNKGLWGGEGVIVGLRKKKPMAVRIPMILRPNLTRRVLYSEILDKHFHIQVTLRTLNLIDEAYGLDHYILKTHEVDLNSQLGMKLKGEMLRALAKKTLYPKDEAKREKVYQRYKQYVIPEEEAEWVGLTLPQALRKARKLDGESNPVVPLKHHFTKEFIERSSEWEPEEQSKDSWMNKMNPFASKTGDKS